MRTVVAAPISKLITSTKHAFGWLRWPAWAVYCCCFVAFLAISWLRLDPDFGWHLKCGQLYLASGFLAHEPFTYTMMSYAWQLEWLLDAILALIYGLGGYLLVAIVYAGIWTAAVRLFAGKRPLLVVLVPALVAMMPYAGVRTVAWSALLFGVLYRLLYLPRHWWLLPPLFALWANMHGSFVLGFALIGYFAVWRRSWKLALVGVLSVMATFVTPYGLGLYREILSILFDATLKTTITEWASFAVGLPLLTYICLWAVGSLTRAKRWQSYIGLDVIFLALGLSSSRHIPLFVLFSLPVTMVAIREIARRWPAQLDAPKLIVTALMGALLVGTTVAAFIDAVPKSLDRESSYPREIVARLGSQPCAGNLFNAYNVGGYLIWKLPSHKVFIDGRGPSWPYEGGTFITRYNQVLNDNTYQQRQFAKYGVTCALINNGSNLEKRLIQAGWSLELRDSSGYDLLRQ